METKSLNEGAEDERSRVRRVSSRIEVWVLTAVLFFVAGSDGPLTMLVERVQ